MDQFLGEIRLVGFNFAPLGWAFCNGQMMSIRQNTALYSLLGNSYGGDGTTTFALPNLQSRVVVGQGRGTGLSPYNNGQMGGVESTTLIPGNIPPHTHTVSLQASTSNATVSNPQGAIFANANDGNGNAIPVYTQGGGNTTMSPQMTSVVGSGLSFGNVQPYIAMNYIIALQGIYPSRS